MVVDDRAAIIGSANINERSMLGSRDSEVAAIVRDTDMISSTMAGKPFLVGRFPHTLRMRLMREHLGIDVDELLEHDFSTEEELRKIQVVEEGTQPTNGRERRESESSMIERQDEREMMERRHRVQDEFLSRSEHMHSFNHDVDWEQGKNPNLKSNRRLTSDPRVTDNPEHKKDVDGDGVDRLIDTEKAGLGVGRDSQMSPDGREALLSPIAAEGKGTVEQPKHASERKSTSTRKDGKQSCSVENARDSEATTNSDTPSQGHATSGSSSRESAGGLYVSKETQENSTYNPFVPDLKRIFVDKDCMKDPVNDNFYLDTWQALAEKNTKIYRSVFRCMPDSEVKNWKEYKEYATYGERFAEMQSQQGSKPAPSSNQKQNGPPSAGVTSSGLASPTSVASPRFEGFPNDLKTAQTIDEKAELAKTDANGAPQSDLAKQETLSSIDEKAALKTASDPHLLSTAQNNEDSIAVEDAEKPRAASAHVDYSEAVNLNATTSTSQSRRRRRRATTIGSKGGVHGMDEIMDKQRAEDLLNKVQGHLILWPYDWYDHCLLILTIFIGRYTNSSL
jgi:phospholipase D1/2